MLSTPHFSAAVAHQVITDITICIPSSTDPSDNYLDSEKWHRIEKDLYLHTSQQSAYLYVALANEKDISAEDLVVTDIRAGEIPSETNLGHSWESRAGGIWVLRENFSGDIRQAITEVDVLFGTDAVDPRPQWKLMTSSLRLNASPEIPVARLSILNGRAKREPRPALRVQEDGKFKIVQISDTHMGTGVGVCKDAIDAHGKYLPKSEADPLTVNFVGNILDTEQPHLVVLTGDQLHHDISDSQTALFKVVAPIIERFIPFAAVFGNHDSEGAHALSRTEQMSILQNLPLSLCEPGPEEVDGIGNFYLPVLAPAPSQLPLSTLYFLDSHGLRPGKVSEYDYIKQSQIDWFTEACQMQQGMPQESKNSSHFHLSLAFLHIPLPEFGDRNIQIYKGHRREPTEGPIFNSHFYAALVKEGISALGCGHDHVNDFCALLPKSMQRDGSLFHHHGPWLCYGGGSGFGGYCSYGGKRFHRRTRVWELDTYDGSLRTWTRIEYSEDRINELVLVKNGAVAVPLADEEVGNV